MKIAVERTEEADSLTFTIKVTEPHHAPFTQEDERILSFLQGGIANISEDPSAVAELIKQAIHHVQAITFNKIKENLCFAIHGQLVEKVKPMQQDIYNWLYDRQPPHLKQWMQEFDPQRTKYYFDNDKPATTAGYEDD